MKAFLLHRLLAGGIFALLTFNALGLPVFQKTLTSIRSDSTPTKKVTYKIFEAEKHSFGYDIFIDNKIMVHQPTIPCIAGNLGFNTKKEADKVARLVIQKVQKGIIPPTVTIKEMETLGISLQQ